MREIKFRAWDKKGKAWIYSNTNGMAWFWSMVEDYHCEVMQFTSLRDKNGKEIYEGDLIALTPTVKYYREVFYGNGEWLLRHDAADSVPLACVNTSHPEAEVIGNIYEDDPALVEMNGARR